MVNNMNEKRELAGLTEAARTFVVEELLILTFDQRDTVELAGAVARVLPVWEWLLTPAGDGSTGDNQEV